MYCRRQKMQQFIVVKMIGTYIIPIIIVKTVKELRKRGNGLMENNHGEVEFTDILLLRLLYIFR